MITNEEIERRFNEIINECYEIFRSKLEDYGPTWAIFREISLTDQLWIKIKRIRTIDDTPSLVPEPARDSFVAIINYAIIWQMRIGYPDLIPGSARIVEDVSLMKTMDSGELCDKYLEAAQKTFRLFRNKNHDYNNAWQEMSGASIIDLIMIKILRIKNIVESGAKLIASEDIDGQLDDIIIYAMFALIKADACA